MHETRAGSEADIEGGGRVRPDTDRPRPAASPARDGSGPAQRPGTELATLVAQGRTDADTAAQLYISIRTVRSHLDRIRDETGCRRRADLTRLALSESLV
jgi:DNA-binding CsgD family transcriptional regulator